MNILQGMHIYIKNELKTGENESMQENENDLFTDGVPPINIVKESRHTEQPKQLAHTISMIYSKTVIYSKKIS